MRRFVLVGAALAVAAGVGSAGDGPQPATAAAGAVKIRVLSNRTDLISGGDALVEIVVGKRAARTLRVDVDGRDVTDSFAFRPNGRFQGLVTGLEVGDNVLTARLPDGHGARIAITNHPSGGPIFAGPQVQPWICATEGAGLGPPQDAQCNAPRRFELLYKSALTGQFRAYNPASPPADLARTTTDEGKTVPYVVRRETGTVDRGIYHIVVLWDPNAPDWTPWSPHLAWNRKLAWFFGGGCAPDHSPGQPTNMLDPFGIEANLAETVEYTLSRGWALATSSLNVLGQQCNDVVSAEAVMMVKEYFGERYGEVRYTIGHGASGGSMQQHWISSNYPGLLDAIQPYASYPDIWETMQEAEDCYLLDRVFDQTSPALWANSAQRAAVAGYPAETTCRSFWDTPTTHGFARTWLDPANAAGCGLDAALVYDAETNPTGVRCTLQDYGVAIWGRRAVDGFANRPLDNAGVQYGLNAVNSGVITAEQFVDLNEKVGGLDIDWNWQPQRSEADPAALTVAYRSGRVTFGRESAKVPIVDLRGTSNFEIHSDVHSHVMRARLIAANGHDDNQVLWNSDAMLLGDRTKNMQEQAVDLLDRWLSAIQADRRKVPLEQKVRENKPGDAVDACWIGGQKVTDMAVCRAALPYFATPRIAAGGPLADNVLKCQLKPLSRADYTVTFTDAQWARLQAAFPSGVCDYRKAPVGQRPSIPWLTYQDGPGGKPLPPAPKSEAF